MFKRINILVISTLFVLLGFSMVYAASLTTTYFGGNGQDGNMFEITALNTVTITSFDGNMDDGTDNWLIYYKVGTYSGFEQDESAWTLVGTAENVTSNGANIPTHIPIPINIAIPAGETYSFYVTTGGAGVGVGYTNGTTEHAVYVADVNIEIKEGTGNGYAFNSVYRPRVWNGTVNYATEGAIPTLNEWGVIIFSLIISGIAVFFLKRKEVMVEIG